MSHPDGTAKHSSKPFVIITGRCVVIACILCPIATCAITFPLFLGLHGGAMDTVRGYRQIPTISGTGQFFPERLIFTYGLHLEGVLLAILFLLVHTKLRNKIADITASSLSEVLWYDPINNERQNVGRDFSELTLKKAMGYLFCFWRRSKEEKAVDFQYLTFWNNSLTFLGLSASFLLTAVGTVSLSVEPTVHTVLAIIVFVAAILHMLFFYCTLARVLDVTEYDVMLHQACLFMAIPFNVALIVLIKVLWVWCPQGPCVQTAVDLAVAIEYSTAVVILTYFFLFFNLVSRVSLACADSGVVVAHREEYTCAHAAHPEPYLDQALSSAEAKSPAV